MWFWYAYICITLGVASAIECPDRWVTFRGSCYLFGHSTKLSFFEAEHYCRQHGGHLVHINDAVENAFLEDYATSLTAALEFWIGLTDETTEGIWQWYDTMTDASFFDWLPGQPDNYQNNEDCVEFGSFYKYKWNDIHCSALLEPVCEIRETGLSIVG